MPELAAGALGQRLSEVAANTSALPAAACAGSAWLCSPMVCKPCFSGCGCLHCVQGNSLFHAQVESPRAPGAGSSAGRSQAKGWGGFALVKAACWLQVSCSPAGQVQQEVRAGWQDDCPTHRPAPPGVVQPWGRTVVKGSLRAGSKWHIGGSCWAACGACQPVPPVLW